MLQQLATRGPLHAATVDALIEHHGASAAAIVDRTTRRGGMVVLAEEAELVAAAEANAPLATVSKRARVFMRAQASRMSSRVKVLPTGLVMPATPLGAADALGLLSAISARATGVGVHAASQEYAGAWADLVDLRARGFIEVVGQRAWAHPSSVGAFTSSPP